MNSSPKKILLLFSDTGGGHRSSASAVAEALDELYGAQAQVEMVDLLAGYAPWPLNQLGRIYGYLVGLKGIPWLINYRLSDGRRRVEAVMAIFWPWVRGRLFRFVREHPADVIVSCHPIFNHLPLRALARTGRRPLFITLVTDFGTAHAFWCAPGVDRCITATENARRCAIAHGVPAERVIVAGLPVNRRFIEAAQEDPRAVRQRLGLECDRPVILLVGGAEGMGPVRRICRAVVESGVQASIVVIAGRNERLRASLAAEVCPTPVRVEGFVHNMHEWMRAANVLISKAGPSTICEALVVGLPMILSGALPGQEQPNVTYVVEGGAGIWAPSPARVAAAVRELLLSPPTLARMAERARQLAQPDAARRVAEAIWTATESSASAPGQPR